MANLVQALVPAGWLLAATLSVPAADFSHKAALAGNLDCSRCHPAAYTSTQASDNLRPDGKPPRFGHGVSKFNHQLHVKMGPAIPAAIARAIDNKKYLSDPGDIRKHLDTKHPCLGCHRGIDQAESITAALHPRMADCLTCHNQIDPPFSCTKCHAEDAKLKPASHTRDFIDEHSAGKIKDKTGCAVCHGRQFTCLGCH